MKTKVSFNGEWRFHEGDISVPRAVVKSVMYMEAKTEKKRSGPASRDYMDEPEYWAVRGPVSTEPWVTVSVPHDYIITQVPDEKNNNALGYFNYQNAWYRKHFRLEEADEGKRITLLFEAVAFTSTVWVNGCYMLTNRCGYNSFEVDLTDVAVFGGDNVVAVHIDTSENESWWYEGSGIYRPVWLIKSEPVSIDLYGVFVHPEKVGEGQWRVPVDTTLRNDDYEPAEATVEQSVVDRDGKTVCTCSGSVCLEPREKTEFHQWMTADNPDLWDTENPNLYTLKTVVRVNGEVVDVQEDRFGFRTIRFDSNHGFFLNERQVKIKGICNHQDDGFTGLAVPPRQLRYRMELLREMGANGFRCSHYPHWEATMNALDELGFLTMCETRHYETTPEAMAQLEMLIKRDRNHPCVIFWSAGNEEPMHITPEGRRIAKAMLWKIRKLDGTRPVTTAVSNNPADCTVADIVDVMGVNYNLWDFDKLHDHYPDVPLVSTENAATGTTRGWYQADSPVRGYISAYDHAINNSFRSREETWKFIDSREWIAGGYQWDGIEHRGETVWPRLCSQAGAIDLYLNKKDAFYQNQSHWLTTPMVHLLPHWNWSGSEGLPIRVVAYTNCEEAELFLNGVSLGCREVEKNGHAEWLVPYEAGSLKVLARNQGNVAAEDAVETSGPAVGLRLLPVNDTAIADGEDTVFLRCECVDAAGRHVPDAAPFVSFDTNELGAVIGTGSDVCDHTPPMCPDRKMRAGWISILVRAGKQAGQLRVTARAEGLAAAFANITLK